MGRKEDEAYLGADTASLASAPPPYSAAPPYSPDDITNANFPQPDITAAFSALNLANEPLETPSPETCLAHLKLLYAFRALREEVGYADALWGIRDPEKDGEVTKEEMSRLREKRWAVYLARAVDRYEAWWKSLEGRDLTMADMGERGSEAYVAFPDGRAGSGMPWDEKMLIPLGE